MNWTPEPAYAVGLITTDGNLSPDGRHIDLTSTDIQLLETFNVRLFRWLLEIGLTTRKSKTINTLAIPDEVFADFVRGHLDGDGSIRVYQDTKYPNSQRLYVMFYSASNIHLQWLQKRMNQLYQLKGYINQHGKICGLYYAKRESLVLLKKIYYAIDVPCLLRKRKQAEQFL